MNYVVRRKTPRHDGSRYFNAHGPAQSDVARATRFAEEDAAKARLALKEPHLWEVLHIDAAVEIETAAIKARRVEHRARPRGRSSTLALWALASSGIVDAPPRRGS